MAMDFVKSVESVVPSNISDTITDASDLTCKCLISIQLMIQLS